MNQTESPLRTEFCGLVLDSPVILLSGCVGFGEEYTRIKGFSNRDVGGIVLKGTTLEGATDLILRTADETMRPDVRVLLKTDDGALVLLTYRGMRPAERKERVNEALEKVEMAHRAKHLPSQLSGGQQQRVAVARAVAGQPSILLADEPTGNLDSKNGNAVMTLLEQLHGEGSTICIVTHDPRYALHAGREIHLFDGKIVNDQSGDDRTRPES